MSKKGFLFTAFAVLFVLVITTIASTEVRLYPRAHSEGERIQLMDQYLTNLEKDLPRVAYIAGFRGFIGLEEHISTNGVYFANFNDAFTSIVTNGTVNGTYYSIMDDSTVDDFKARFESLSVKQGIIANLSLLSVTAYQNDPWTILLNTTFAVHLEDVTRSAQFNQNISFIARVPIEGIKDPVYSIGTQGKTPHTFKQVNLTRPYISATNDTTKLQTIVNQTLYVESTQAPDVLQRFQGNFTPSANGIFSIVNVKELQAQSIIVNTCKSLADYMYFDTSNTPTNYVIVNMDSNFFWINQTNFDDLDANGKDVGTKLCT